MTGYALINNEELGINTYIKKNKNSKYIMFKGDNETKEIKLYLNNRSIAF
jgi:hypothetical protein